MTSPLRNERGIALATALLITLMVVGMATTALMMTTNGRLLRKANDRIRQADLGALSGLEEARSRLNGTASLYPSTGYVTLENGVSVTDGAGTTIPGARRWTWAGPSGVSTGQYGVFATILSKVTMGNVTSLRRRDLNQESFAKFAYFTNNEAGLPFQNGDLIQGPVHSNDQITIGSTGATFTGKVTSHASSISGVSYGNFQVGYTLNAATIAIPTITQLATMSGYATSGGTYFDPGVAYTNHPAATASRTSGDAGETRTRIEFVAVDLNADGDSIDADEGFFKVYMGHNITNTEEYVSATVGSRESAVSTSMINSYNCGDFGGVAHGHMGQFQLLNDALNNHNSTARRWDAALMANSRCYLGGSNQLNSSAVGGTFVVNNAYGTWIPYTGTVDSRLVSLGRADRNYLFPLSRSLNVNFKGVIYVNGKVGVSGVVRGRVSVVSPNSIIILDDLRQANDPSTGLCNDIIGLITSGNIVLSENLLNAPQFSNSGSTAYKSFDDTSDEFIQAVMLTLGIFTDENHTLGPLATSTGRENCESIQWGRGCLYVTGGIVQETRGAVGTGSGTGHKKRYSYNACAGTNPPPYFPTTGRFEPNRIYEMDPVGFSAAAWFAANQN